MVSRCPTNFTGPSLLNLILTFITYTSAITHSTTAGTFLATVWRYSFCFGLLPFTNQEFFGHTCINEVPWKDFICAAFTQCIKFDVNTCLFESFFPDIVVETFGPGIVKSTLFVCFKNNFGAASVTSTVSPPRAATRPVQCRSSCVKTTTSPAAKLRGSR